MSITAAPSLVCSVAPSVSCFIQFQPAYGVWATPDDGNIPAIGTTSYLIDPNDDSTTSTVICNWDAVSTSYYDVWTASGQQLNPEITPIGYTVDSSCNLVASILAADATDISESIAVTYPDVLLQLGTFYDVSSETFDGVSCDYVDSTAVTTDILYTDAFSAVSYLGNGEYIWDLPALTEYLPGEPAASECPVTFGTQPNTLRPATYLTSYSTLPLTSTDAAPASVADGGAQPTATPQPTGDDGSSGSASALSPANTVDQGSTATEVQTATVTAQDTSDPFQNAPTTSAPYTSSARAMSTSSITSAITTTSGSSASQVAFGMSGVAAIFALMAVMYIL